MMPKAAAVLGALVAAAFGLFLFAAAPVRTCLTSRRIT
jgi:hypothetical protein